MINKTIDVQHIEFASKPDIELVNSMFDTLPIPIHSIDIQNWKEYEYNAKVNFRIAYSDTEIYLQFIVNEPYIKASYKQDEGAAPYKDSCVEFFFIPDNQNYYNLEMNCLGKGTFAGGSERANRTRYGKDIMTKIRRLSSLSEMDFAESDIIKANDNESLIEWSLTIAIPLEIFTLEQIGGLKGKTLKANFYKCGDDMPIKHYFSWNPILTEKPSFHTPQFFGTLNFK